jgi:hypothetical protein
MFAHKGILVNSVPPPCEWMYTQVQLSGESLQTEWPASGLKVASPCVEKAILL